MRFQISTTMNDFQGLLSGDYGFKPQGKSAPMAPPRSNHSTANSPFDFNLAGSSSTTTEKASYSKSSTSSVFLDDQDDFFFGSINSPTSQKNRDFGNLGGLDDVYGDSSKSHANSSANLDSVFSGPADSGSRFSSLPVFDKPVYDDDVLDGVPGLKNSRSAKYEDVFSSSSSKMHDAFDDILGGFARKEPESKGLDVSGQKTENNFTSFDDLLPGFGLSTAPSDRNPAESRWDTMSNTNGLTKATSDVEDPFGGLSPNLSDALSSQGLYIDPLEQFTELGGSSRKKTENVSVFGELFDDLDPPIDLGKSVPMNDREKVGSPVSTGTTLTSKQTSASVEVCDRSASVKSPPSVFENTMAPDDSYSSAPNTSSSSFVNVRDETVSKRHTSTVYGSNPYSSGDLWLTVSEIPLLTQPTAAPPPSRAPPPKPPRISKVGSGPYIPLHGKKKTDEHPSFPNSAEYFQSPQSPPVEGKSSFTSPIDELEDFAKGSSWNDSDGNFDVQSGSVLERDSEAAVSAAVASAAAMKEAMDRAEARFKHAKDARERENAKAARMQQEREDIQERDSRDKERQERERQLREEEETKQSEEEEKLQRERVEREREQRRIERERIEREHARQAVDRATREARERAAADARARAEKAAVGKVQAEARERAERAAVMKAQAEARERAARAAVEAKKRADREKAEREAKEKEAHEKAAAASARANHQKNEDDLDLIFGMGSRANSAPKATASSSDPLFDPQFPKKQSGSASRTSVESTPSMRKMTSSANIVDDLSFIFGGAHSAGDFHDVEGETEERRRARLERHQRTQERAAKALAEKNKRDLDAQKEQAERHRIAETLDVEIKRWAAGKEGNLRALLSTMQYVLWPECGWQQVSLTDLITAAAVKKVYRKATLSIHPDKVQQKGANLQQKYIAEKVFDLLKEAWNKFNSEELF